MIEWRPIETAPRDGSVVLLCGGKTSEWMIGDDRIDQLLALRPVTGFWRKDEDEFNDNVWCVFYWDSGWRSTYDNPTHWSPLNLPEGSIYE